MNLLERCFEGAPNIPRRLRKLPESVDKADEHLEKANRNILAANLMNENKLKRKVKKMQKTSKEDK
ncbi:MAG: hypothetical protein AB1391_03360 [Candidatus Micrarchaeota archaeon]